jgi:hypothetical protein
MALHKNLFIQSNPIRLNGLWPNGLDGQRHSFAFDLADWKIVLMRYAMRCVRRGSFDTHDEN